MSEALRKFILAPAAQIRLAGGLYLNSRKTFWEMQKQVALEAYWWLQIVRLSEAGEWPAWEGIRIVREQIDSIA